MTYKLNFARRSLMGTFLAYNKLRIYSIKESYMKWSKGIIYLCRLIFLINSVYLICILKFDRLVLLLGSLLLTFVPELYTKWTKVNIPIGARLFYTLFIFAAQWLGSYLGFYGYIPCWDVLLHATSGIFIGYVALIILVSLDRSQTLFKQNKIGVIVTFVVAVGIAAAGIWEIIEFSGDVFLGTNAQLGSLQDTMEDIVCGTLGSGAFAVYIGLVMKARRRSCIDQLLQINGDKNK